MEKLALTRVSTARKQADRKEDDFRYAMTAFPQNVVNKNTVLRLNVRFFYFCLLRWKWLSAVTAKNNF